MIVHLADYAAEYTGNFIYSLLKLSESVKKIMNMDTVIVFPKEAKNKKWISMLNNSGIEIIFIDMSNNRKEKVKKIIKKINEIDKKPYIFHTHFARFEMESIDLKKHYKSYLVQHKHMGAERNSIKYRIYDLYKYKYLSNKYVDYTIVISDFVRNIMKKSGIKDNKLVTIYNKIFIDKHKKNELLRKEGREKLEFLEKDKVVLFFGYNVNVKGTDILIDSIDYINEEFKFILVGTESMVKYLQCNDKYLKHKRRFRIVDHTENVSELFNVSDIFLSASRREGFSYAIGEAMLYEKQILMSDIEGCKHYLKNNNVKKFENENYLDLARKLNNIPNSNCKNNRDFIKDNFNLDMWIGEIINLYIGIRTRSLK